MLASFSVGDEPASCLCYLGGVDFITDALPFSPCLHLYLFISGHLFGYTIHTGDGSSQCFRKTFGLFSSVKGLVNSRCKRRGEPEETAGAKLGRPIEGRFPFKNKRKDCGVLQIRLRQMKGKIGKRACTAARGRGLPLPKLTRFSQIKLNYTVILTHQDKVDRKLSPIKREQGECILIGYSWYFVILEKKCARHSAVPMFSSILCLVSRVLCFKNANGERGKKWPRICSLRCKCQKTIVVCRP